MCWRQGGDIQLSLERQGLRYKAEAGSASAEACWSKALGRQQGGFQNLVAPTLKYCCAKLMLACQQRAQLNYLGEVILADNPLE